MRLLKIGRIASESEEITLEIIRCKCIPVLLCGTEAFTLNKSERSLLDFAVNRLSMKLFKTNNTDTFNFVNISLDFTVGETCP